MTESDFKKTVEFEKVEVYILGLKKTYSYYMTNDFKLLCKKLDSLGYSCPASQDWRWNPSLCEEVRNKMSELGAIYSMTFSFGTSILNFYSKESNFPHIVYLEELKTSPFERLSFAPKVCGAWPPLMYAVRSNSIEFVKFLISQKENVNFQDKVGATPLLLAVMNKNTEIIKALINAGANVNVMTNKGFNILTFAILSNKDDSHTEIIKILENAGAEIKGLCITPKNLDEKVSFHETLNFFISKATFGGIGKVSSIYKHTQLNGSGGLSKQTFSKIRSNADPNYHPNKKTVFLLAIGMELSLEQSETLLSSAGYFFDEKSKFDSIVKNFIRIRNFNMEEIEKTLYAETGECLGNWKE